MCERLVGMRNAAPNVKCGRIHIDGSVHRHLIYLPVWTENQSIPHLQVYGRFRMKIIQFGLTIINQSTQVAVEPRTFTSSMGIGTCKYLS